MSVEKTKLNNGLIVATDSIPNFETVSVGIFVNVGSVNENPSQSGISHFVEHMAFKGTEKRTALEISSEIESVGGYMNAYTSKEVTAFHAKVLKQDFELAVDVISDIVQNSTFNSEEFEKERGVIIQEIKQQNDTPDDLVFDMFQGQCFDGESLGTPILGTEENILSFKSDDLAGYLKGNYSTDKMIICASGGIEHAQLVDLANKYCDGMKEFQTETPRKQIFQGGFLCKEKDLEQTHIVMGFEGFDNKSEHKFDLFVLSTILGGGMSSRLFQEIREKRGLAYSIFSFTSNYRDTGTFGVYSGCDSDNAREVVKIVKEELLSVSATLEDREIEKAKTQIKASLLMGLESSSSRMERMAGQYLLQGQFLTPADITSKIDTITKVSVIKAAEIILATSPTVAVIGNGEKLQELYDAFK